MSSFRFCLECVGGVPLALEAEARMCERRDALIPRSGCAGVRNRPSLANQPLMRSSIPRNAVLSGRLFVAESVARVFHFARTAAHSALRDVTGLGGGPPPNLNDPLSSMPSAFGRLRLIAGVRACAMWHAARVDLRLCFCAACAHPGITRPDLAITSRRVWGQNDAPRSIEGLGRTASATGRCSAPGAGRESHGGAMSADGAAPPSKMALRAPRARGRHYARA